MLETDFLIVGAGIAGASIAYRLAPHGKVTLIDMEAQPGYHTTGRSAAFFAETYGGPLVQPLTTASKAFFQSITEGFSETPLMSALGALHIFKKGQEAKAEELFNSLKNTIENVHLLGGAEVRERLPQLRSEDIAGAIYDADCGSLDVAAIHHGFLKGAKAHGAELLMNAPLRSARFQDGHWVVDTQEKSVRARVLINAAGAWADTVAERAGVNPLGLEPLRRTVVKVQNPVGLPYAKDCPIVLEVGSEHYFKPEGGGYLITPGDEVRMPACDVQPEEEDIALAVHLFEQATNTKVERVENKWAGLRTFARDRMPVIGFDAHAPSFFWSVGQGGFGIQTAPAWSELAANMVLGRPVSSGPLAGSANIEAYSPARLSGNVSTAIA